MLSLKAEKRDPKENLALLRGKGLVPAVYYGSKVSSAPITIDRVEFIKLYRETGETGVISLETPDGKYDVLVHEVQLDPVKSVPVHVDFYAVEKGQKVEVDVPLVFEGVPPAVKNLGGVLMKVMHEISVEADPTNIPSEIVVDVSTLEDFESQITVADLSLPVGAVAKSDPAEVVASAAAPQEEEEEPEAEIDMDAIEVEAKGKKEEEGEATE